MEIELMLPGEEELCSVLDDAGLPQAHIDEVCKALNKAYNLGYDNGHLDCENLVKSVACNHKVDYSGRETMPEPHTVLDALLEGVQAEIASIIKSKSLTL